MRKVDRKQRRVPPQPPVPGKTTDAKSALLVRPTLKNYVAACLRMRAGGKTTFRKLWRQLVPYIVCTRLLTEASVAEAGDDRRRVRHPACHPQS